MKTSIIKDCKTSAQAVTAICYNEETRNLDFQIQTNNIDDLKECIKIIDQYNEFDSSTINTAIDNFLNLKIWYGKDNLNNGKDLYEVKIGRENSPVMYVTLQTFMRDTLTLKMYRKETELLPIMTIDTFKDTMREFAHATKADECDFTKDGMGITCRMWWD